ncbi:pilus assembly PilX N-terminal domain-containing protein [Clostridium algoriphilum]|uniref:PilX N-terminal domain-containing pilus assembly protein n=1 Tax=Clostridium algoriphilum TaxID=198347 RepID=UPI001CF52803|nr:pilus assembly PilX N-terminal domain-containing protein [Clostridium algoriphilum]MCB2295209.1 pilus assembly PilX N-terminal domain-containing protein [Clostridium algoriphilum]
MIPKKNKGSALIVVIMVMAVMTILGATILNISLSQTKQASYEDKRIQAHYLARSGAEATLSAWKNATSNNKPNGSCSTIYLNNLNQFVNVESSNMIGKFDVIITKPDGVTTIITSVGNVGNVIQTTTVTITTVITEITYTPGPTVSGDSLKWYDSKSGQASVGNHTTGDRGVTVLVSNPGLKLVHGLVDYQADTINFTTDIWNFKYPLTLNAGMVIFNTTIDTNRNGSNDGRLILQVLPSAGVTRADQIDKTVKWGRIEYNSQWYYFQNNTTILTDNAFNSLEKIPITDPNFPGSSKQQISSYSIKWS